MVRTPRATGIAMVLAAAWGMETETPLAAGVPQLVAPLAETGMVREGWLSADLPGA
jgi:hypothetical protein